MKRIGWLLVLVCSLMLLGMNTGCGFNAKAQAGAVNVSPSVEVEHGWFSGTHVKIDTVGRVTADTLNFKKNEGLTASGLVIDSNPVPMVDARTNQILTAFLPLSKENTELNRVYGANAVAIIDAMGFAAERVLNGLPAGQLRQAVVGVVEAIAEAKVECVKAASTQPAVKPDGPVAPVE